MRITINNGTSHLKTPKNQIRRGALGRPAIKLLYAHFQNIHNISAKFEKQPLKL